MTAFAWKLVYDDGSSFTSEDGAPNDSPPWGAVAVAQPEVENRDLIWGADFLLYRSDLGFWTGHDLVGLVDQATHFSPSIVAVRPGREMNLRDLKKIVRDLGLEMRGR